MLTYIEAQAILQKQAHSFGTEKIPLDKALGRVLAENIFADRDYPPFNRSAMDGYALKYADFEKGLRSFEVIEVIYAGSENEKKLGNGQCYKIMTGAAIPNEADVVIRREDVAEGEKEIHVQLSACRPFQNIARRGEDVQKGNKIFQEACICTPTIIALLATLGKYEVQVGRLPRVALFTTGNEVVPVEAAVKPFQIRNSNRWLLRNLLQKWEIETFICEHIPDDVQQLEQAIEKALSADILILSGGVSAGDADYVPQVLEKLGVQKLFHKVAIKPGKPFWCGKLPSGGMVFALPGNPFSCLVTFTLFIQHYLRHCFRLPDLPSFRLPFKSERKKKTPLDEFFPVRFGGEPLSLLPVDINGSGDIRLGLHADALAHHPAEKPQLLPGELVTGYWLNR